MFRLFERCDRWADGWYRAEKTSLLQTASGRVLEIGAGTGVNFPYLNKGCEVVCVEPNVLMHERLRKHAAEAGTTIEILDSKAESLPIPDASMDFVIGTLVLCSVDNVATVLDEVARVLKPGGQYLFIEHVRGTRTMLLFQRILSLPWKVVFGNCRLTRDPRVEFSLQKKFEVIAKPIAIGPWWMPIRPHLVGHATKKSP
jgi:ubiquinone/menaquinone biosynthesis C-methylase UbiE